MAKTGFAGVYLTIEACNPELMERSCKINGYYLCVETKRLNKKEELMVLIIKEGTIRNESK